jgi:hypothetical protein
MLSKPVKIQIGMGCAKDLAENLFFRVPQLSTEKTIPTQNGENKNEEKTKRIHID